MGGGPNKKKGLMGCMQKPQFYKTVYEIIYEIAHIEIAHI
jgi:hypothetical protein